MAKAIKKRKSQKISRSRALPLEPVLAPKSKFWPLFSNGSLVGQNSSFSKILLGAERYGRMLQHARFKHDQLLNPEAQKIMDRNKNSNRVVFMKKSYPLSFSSLFFSLLLFLWFSAVILVQFSCKKLISTWSYDRSKVMQCRFIY